MGWRGLCFVLLLHSALTEILTLLMMIIKRQNKHFDDVTVFTACDLAGKVQGHNII